MRTRTALKMHCNQTASHSKWFKKKINILHLIHRFLIYVYTISDNRMIDMMGGRC